MKLWTHWISCVLPLRKACSRTQTFMWMLLALVGFSIRSELLGVTSFVRAYFLIPEKYTCFLRMFHSSAIDLQKLTDLWVRFVFKRFSLVTFNGYPLLITDGLKVPKEGKKMPGVKSLHQESDDNSKHAFIMGHSFQAIGLLVSAPMKQFFCVPLISRIHEGLVWSNRDKRTLLDKLVELFSQIVDISMECKTILVADAYYASRKIIIPLLLAQHHLVTRLRSNSVAYYPAPIPEKRKRGRPKLYGKKIQLKNYWKRAKEFCSAPSPVYGEEKIQIEYLVRDLLWRPIGKVVRFVFVKHPTRGRMILLTTFMDLDPLDVIRIYGYRFKIEVSFKQALRTLGAYGYHFWMKMMTPIKRKSGNQYMHKKSEDYRYQVKRKIAAYHCYVQLGCIAQGILQYLAVSFHDKVWLHFNSWLRTMKCDRAPSEMVVAYALRNTFPEFLLTKPDDPNLEKFMAENIDLSRVPGLKLSA